MISLWRWLSNSGVLIKFSVNDVYPSERESALFLLVMLTVTCRFAAMKKLIEPLALFQFS